MTQILDPNDPNFSFQAEQEKLAELLRQGQGQRVLGLRDLGQESGQMVSGHFVAKNPLQYIANLASVLSGQTGIAMAQQGQGPLDRALRRQRSDTLATFPTAQNKMLPVDTPTPVQGSYAAAGTPMPETGGEAPVTLGGVTVNPQGAPTPTAEPPDVQAAMRGIPLPPGQVLTRTMENRRVPPDPSEYMKWAAKAMETPGMEGIANLAIKQAISDPKLIESGGHLFNADTGQWIQNPWRMEEITQKHDLDVQKLFAALQMNAGNNDVKMQLGQMHDQHERSMIDIHQQLANTDEAYKRALAEAAREKASLKGAGNPLKQEQEKFFDARSQVYSSLQNLRTRYKEDKDLQGSFSLWEKFKNQGAAALGGVASEKWQKVRNFWSDYDRLVNIPERFRFFGATLTAGEDAAWKRATIKEGDSPERVLNYLQDVSNSVAVAMNAKRSSDLSQKYNQEAIDWFFKYHGVPISGPGEIPTGGATSSSLPATTGGTTRPKAGRILGEE